MKPIVKIKSNLLAALVLMLICTNSFAQKIPLVYNVENTGANFPKPDFPSIDQLPTVEPLPDPFEWADGSGRDTTFVSWEHRRNEIGAQIEHYEIGPKPDRPDTITASFSNDTLKVNITKNGKTLTLISKVILPEGTGPFPAVIGIGRGSGSLPSNIFSSRNIAQIPFNFGQVMAWQQKRGNEPINKLYPDLTYMGAYAAWSWGISRLIDGLELVQKNLPIDLHHLAVTGCSFAGKMALFAGAFDERIALTIAQESGGGGYTAWRVSENLGNVETLGRTSHLWFMEDLFKFAKEVPKLPYDHHELMAMVAPRALYVTGNPNYEWLADESGYVASRATQRIYKTFGIPDRFGFSIVGGHQHCQVPESQIPEIGAFVDKFLLGDKSVNTNIETNPYKNVDYSRWTAWWGSGDPVFPKENSDLVKSSFFEAECATVGANWKIVADSNASNGSYVTVKPGIQSLSAAPSAGEGLVVIPFQTDTTGNYNVFARLNCPSADDDSFWVKMDDDSFTNCNGLGTSGWAWVKLGKYSLKSGEHKLSIGYREDGAKLDKICITNAMTTPSGMGKEAQNRCKPEK